MGLRNVITRYKNKKAAKKILHVVSEDRGLLWERIEKLAHIVKSHDESINRGTPEMDEIFPVKHHFKDGLYTRELFMPKGSLVISLIHKQNHPSFFMEGEMSIVSDDGQLKRIKAPMVVQTEIGTQRIAYMHEDVKWVCVYKTDKETIEEAEAEVYTEDFRMLPEYIIKRKSLCQDYSQQ